MINSFIPDLEMCVSKEQICLLTVLFHVTHTSASFLQNKKYLTPLHTCIIFSYFSLWIMSGEMRSKFHSITCLASSFSCLSFRSFLDTDEINERALILKGRERFGAKSPEKGLRTYPFGSPFRYRSSHSSCLVSSSHSLFALH